MWGIQKNNKKNEIRNFFFSVSINVRFLEKLPLKLNKQHYACDRQTDMKNNLNGYVWQTYRHEKKMREGVLSKNIWEGASERRNENIIVSWTLKTNYIFNYYYIQMNQLHS